MYRDRDKQRIANREHAKAYRLRQKGMTEGMTQGMTKSVKGMTQSIPKTKDELVIPERKGVTVAHHLTCKCMRCMG